MRYRIAELLGKSVAEINEFAPDEIAGWRGYLRWKNYMQNREQPK